MLILTRNFRESIMIGDNIKITVIKEDQGKIHIGINASRDVPVHREEVYNRIKNDQETEDS